LAAAGVGAAGYGSGTAVSVIGCGVAAGRTGGGVGRQPAAANNSKARKLNLSKRMIITDLIGAKRPFLYAFSQKFNFFEKLNFYEQVLAKISPFSKNGLI
jgi:hypothetical protein